jgi:hypothetical protein
MQQRWTLLVNGWPVLVLCATIVFAQETAGPPWAPNSKALEATLAYGQSLTQWGLLILGGSVAILLGTSYHAPRHRLVRLSYVLFLPGWILLGLSMLSGTTASRVYLAFLWGAGNNPEATAAKIDAEIFCQLRFIEFAILTFGTWLVVYLVWWVFLRPAEQPNRVAQ